MLNLLLFNRCGVKRIVKLFYSLVLTLYTVGRNKSSNIN